MTVKLPFLTAYLDLTPDGRNVRNYADPYKLLIGCHNVFESTSIIGREFNHQPRLGRKLSNLFLNWQLQPCVESKRTSSTFVLDLGLFWRPKVLLQQPERNHV